MPTGAPPGTGEGGFDPRGVLPTALALAALFLLVRRLRRRG
jgi:hypothetical protein